MFNINRLSKLKTLILIGTVLGILIMVPIRRSQGSNGAGWLTGFTYRKSHSVNGSTYGALTDYCIRVNVHRSAGVDSGRDVYVYDYCQSDFDDIRFTNSTSHELEYFLFNSTDDEAQFWVKVDSIPASPSQATIYMYFGNSTVSTTSNDGRTSLYDHGDDFNDQSRNTTLWDIWKNGGASDPEETAEGLLRCYGHSPGYSRGYVSVNEYDVENTEVSIFYNNTRLAEGGLSICHVHHTSTHPVAGYNYETYYLHLENQSDRFQLDRKTGNVKTTRFTQTWVRGDNYLRMRFNGSHIIIVEGETVQFSESYGIDSGDYTKYFYIIALYGSGYTGNDFFDNFFIRKYYEPEPINDAWGAIDPLDDPLWENDELLYRKPLMLVSRDDVLTDYPIKVITHSGSEAKATHGVLGDDTKGPVSTYPTVPRIYGSRYVPNATGYIDELACYVKQNGSDYVNITVAIYASMFNASFYYPSRLLAYASTPWLITAGWDDWRSWALNTTLGAGPDMWYWLMVWVENTTKNSEGCFLYRDSALPGSGPIPHDMAYGQFPNWPDPFPYKDPPRMQGTHMNLYANMTSETYDNTTEVWLNNHALADFSDVQFTYVNSSTSFEDPISYWRDPDFLYSGDNATFWVKVPRIENTSVTYCWCYYGNQSAISTLSNGTNVFWFFDEFNGTAEPPDGWSETTQGTSSWSDVSENSYYKVYNFQDDASHWHGNLLDKSVTPSTSTGWEIEWRTTLNCSVSDIPQANFWIRLYNASTEKVRLGFADGGVAVKGKIYSWITGTAGSEPDGTRYANTSYFFRIRSDGTNIITYWNSTQQQSKALTDPFDEIRLYFVAGRSTASDNPQGLSRLLFLRPYGTDPWYAWAPEGYHGLNMTYYYSAGGVFWVNSTAVVNGSSVMLFWSSSLSLGALGNTSMVFNNFTISGAVNVTTGLNPYLVNFTSSVTTVTWCRWRAETRIIRYDMFFGGLIIVACIAGLIGYSTRRRW